MKYDYDGSGVEREICMSPHTLMVYEQQFKSGLIEDVFGRFNTEGHEEDVDSDGLVIVRDFTVDNWTSYPRVLWAMLKAGHDLAVAEHRKADYVPPFDVWSVKTANLNMDELSRVVVQRIQEDLFRPRAAASKAIDNDAEDEGEASVHEDSRDGDGEVRPD